MKYKLLNNNFCHLVRIYQTDNERNFSACLLLRTKDDTTYTSSSEILNQLLSYINDYIFTPCSGNIVVKSSFLSTAYALFGLSYKKDSNVLCVHYNNLNYISTVDLDLSTLTFIDYFEQL